MQIRKIIAIALLLAANRSFSQLQGRNYFSVTGKKDVAVNVIRQDTSGYLWLGTAEGLFRFDGKRSEAIERFTKKEITALHIDDEGVSWIGTSNGRVYSFQKGRIDSVPLPAKEDKSKITTFYSMAGGLCIGTYGDGLYTWKEKILKHYDASTGLSDNIVYKITGDKRQTIWCGTDAGITEINGPFSHPTFNIISDKNGLPDNIVRDVIFEPGKLRICMQDSGICEFNLNQRKIERQPFYSNWSLGPVINAHSSPPQKLVVATEKQGLLLFDKGAFSIYSYSENQLQSVTSLFLDKSGNIWLTSAKGITQLAEKRYQLLTQASGLPQSKVLAIVTDNDNAIWAGTTSGISRIMTDDQGRTVVKTMPEFSKYTTSCAARAPNGDIWFGTYGNGILVLNSSGTSHRIISSANFGLTNDNISNIYFSGKKVYISTLGGGLIVADLSPEHEGGIKAGINYTEANGLGSNYVYASITDSKGNLYVATDGGGLRAERNGVFVDLTQKAGFESNSVFSLCRDRADRIWATSNADGLLKFDGKNLRRVERSKGLRDDQPQQIVSEGNTVYAINDKGIDRIDCTTDSVTYYDVFDGDLAPNLNAVALTNNRLYSGTDNGILIYRMLSQHGDSVKPDIVIRNLQLNYKPYPLDSSTEFKYYQNNLSVTFQGIWLKNPDKLVYRYKLEGLEDNWTYSNESKTVNYNNLAPGAYRFLVQVRNEEDVWSEPEAYAFTILTPIWKRWWFWLLMLSLASIGIYVFIRYRLRSLQLENALLERRVSERTAQIEKQSRIIESKNKELEQLSLVASKTDNVVLILDRDGRLEYINESFVKRNGLTKEALVSEYGETIYELSNNPSIREIVNEAVSNKRSVSYESLNTKKEVGREIWESSTLTPIFDENGSLRKIIIIDTDVTERKRQEQVIIQKNKDITDSISYARKIQHAILPANEAIRAYIHECFVLYMTKDIVSGDFYWFTHLDGASIIAAVDCTGHGVPGAFMSLIGYNVLNRVVNENRVKEPAEILKQLNDGVLAVLHKNESESKDGMDIAICRIDHDTGIIHYAGAMRPLWIINNGELEEIKADKIPIGTKEKDRNEKIAYTTHTIEGRKNARYYIFTDGYADQFGGKKDKKYSTARFRNLLIETSALSFAEQEEALKAAHLEWKGDNEQIDDILVIGFSI